MIEDLAGLGVVPAFFLLDDLPAVIPFREGLTVLDLDPLGVSGVPGRVGVVIL